MKIRFGIFRLMLAVIGFAVPLAIFNSYGPTTIGIAIIVGCALALIVLIAETKQIWPLVRTALFGIAGTVIGLMCCPMVDPPYNPGDEFGYMIMGCLSGCLAGISWTAIRNPPVDPDDSNNMDAEIRT